MFIANTSHLNAFAGTDRVHGEGSWADSLLDRYGTEEGDAARSLRHHGNFFSLHFMQSSFHWYIGILTIVYSKLYWYTVFTHHIHTLYLPSTFTYCILEVNPCYARDWFIVYKFLNNASSSKFCHKIIIIMNKDHHLKFHK